MRWRLIVTTFERRVDRVEVKVGWAGRFVPGLVEGASHAAVA